MRRKRTTSFAEACLPMPSARLAQMDLLDRRNCDANSVCSIPGSSTIAYGSSGTSSYALRKTSNFSISMMRF